MNLKLACTCNTFQHMRRVLSWGQNDLGQNETLPGNSSVQVGMHIECLFPGFCSAVLWSICRRQLNLKCKTKEIASHIIAYINYSVHMLLTISTTTKEFGELNKTTLVSITRETKCITLSKNTNKRNCKVSHNVNLPTIS